MKHTLLAFTAALALSGCTSIESAPEAGAIDTRLLAQNISKCEAPVRTAKLKEIGELRRQKFDSFSAKLSGSFMTKYVPFSSNEPCTIGLLDNALYLLGAYVANAGTNPDALNDLALAKLMRASFLPPEARNSYYLSADELISQYIAKESDDKHERTSSPHYFAVHTYLEAGQFTKDDAKLALLDKAIEIATTARNGDLPRRLKTELAEPLGIALGEKAKYFKASRNDQFKALIDQSNALFIESFDVGDTLAAYNLAVNQVLLNNADTAKKWLLVIEEKKAIDKQICLQGILGDPDLEWLRKTEREWVHGYFQRNCLEFARSALRPTASQRD